MEGNYIDKKCPFTGNVSIRGRILTGVVKSLKMKRTCVIRRDYLHFIKKYQRFEKRHRNLSAHISPCFRDVELGDLVRQLFWGVFWSLEFFFFFLKKTENKNTMKI